MNEMDGGCAHAVVLTLGSDPESTRTKPNSLTRAHCYAADARICAPFTTYDVASLYL
jgi:hypothetical protein